ncbi:hypothetical protein FDP41_009159 [Naegleria fowleri]|uniref:RGS domain-containing protein n=1 Tax=Naegleria fowleri TaxID=5763 RepID=A0A6A5BEX9_NAEFO|nr:uncharacterized protein FDP41_009159 [Naegleria fowleri]KAF0972554.1 hypothetical protein FDP41_009159 [Naegleria fowleri]
MSPPSEIHQSSSIELQEANHTSAIHSPQQSLPSQPSSPQPQQQPSSTSPPRQHDHSIPSAKNISVFSSPLRIRTCFGVVELSWMRLLSLLSLVVNVVAFIILLALIIWSYAAFQDLDTSTIEYTVMARLYRERLSYSSKTAALYSACLASLNVSVVTPPTSGTTSGSGTGTGTGPCRKRCRGRSTAEQLGIQATNTSQLSTTQAANYDLYVSQEAYTFYNTTLLYNQTISKLLSDLSDHEIQALNLTRLDSIDSSIQFEAQAVNLALKHNGTQALKVLFSDPTYQTKQAQFLQQVLDPVAFYVSDKQNSIAFVLKVQTVVSLVVILAAVSIVIPVVIATLVCALNRDAIQLERLRKANALMAIDTMRDPQLRKYLMSYEKKKFELAKEIYNEFLDMNGSMTVNLSKKKTDVIKHKIEECANSAFPLLEDDLFDSIEREIAQLMLDTHRRFKESLAFKKQMKIDNINTRIKNAASQTK